MPARDPSDRVLVARIAAAERWSREPDRAAATKPARAAFAERFERQVDPDGTLDPVERARRAELAKRAYFARLALKSAQARRRGRPNVSRPAPPSRQAGPGTP
ncbi:hypothetical protein ABZ949_05305 [Micromonospora tulbaghiae]|uniref:hypothetical protein n=1 Tax=Micromonospora tulbaghiae TaxID=479978 RepID=UPI0033C918E7